MDLDYLIKTDRLLLRPPETSDAKTLYKLASDDRITTFLAWEAHKELQTTEILIKDLQEAQRTDKGYHWLICLGDSIIGFISLINIKRNHRTWIINSAELSYWLGIDFQGNGFATEAGRFVLDFAFTNLNIHKIVLGHVEKNIASRKICLKLGFQRYGIEPHAFFKDGFWHNMYWYYLLTTK